MITDEQHLTVCEDIHVDDNMGNEDKALDIIIPDLNSAMTVKDINGDQDIMTGKLNYLLKNNKLIQEQEDLINK